MVKHSQRQKGNAHIVIIVILVLVILGALGFVFWNNLQAKNQTVKAPATTVTKPASPQYLDAAYWSVKFTVPAGLNVNDIVYYKTHIAEGPEYYGFTTKRVQAQGDLCDNQAIGNLVILNRSKTKDGGGTLINTETIGGYYYFIDDLDGELHAADVPDCLKTDIAVQDRILLDQLVKSLVISETTIPIKELGISITVPDSLKDLTYSYSDSNGDKGVSLSTKSLTDAYDGCSASGSAPPLGGLEKFQGQYAGSPYLQLAKQLPVYYITWQNSQAICDPSGNVGPGDLLQDLHNSFASIKEL